MTEDEEEEARDEEAEATEEKEADEEEMEGLQEGDYIKLSYTARVGEGEDERVIDTTDEETAADEGVDTSEREFGPRTIVLGEGHIFEQVEDDIVGEEVGYSNTVVVPAEEAFGEYDPEDVETVSAKKIDEDDRRPGAQVQVDGRQGYVETIIGGRARVDFNHPLAGDDVTYDFEVVDEIEDTVERAEGYIELQTDAEVDVSLGTETRTETRVEGEGDEDDEDAEEVEEEVEVDTLYIEAPQELSMNQQWVMMKSQIVHELMHDFDVERVVVRETYDDNEMHGGMGGMGMGMGGMTPEDLEDMDEEELEELVEEGAEEVEPE